MINRGLRGFKAYNMKGIPSPIYKEGVWMLLEGECEGLLKKGKWLEAWLKLDHGGQVWLLDESVCTLDNFALVLSIDLEQTRAKR